MPTAVDGRLVAPMIVVRLVHGRFARGLIWEADGNYIWAAAARRGDRRHAKLIYSEIGGSRDCLLILPRKRADSLLYCFLTV